jgi:hypothetical protein
MAAAGGGTSQTGNSLQQQRGASVQERQQWAQRLCILMRKVRAWLRACHCGLCALLPCCASTDVSNVLLLVLLPDRTAGC